MNPNISLQCARVALGAALCSASLCFAQPSPANYKDLSDVLAIGIPLFAAGVSYARDDTPGLLQLGKSELATLAATEGLKRALPKDRPNGRDNQSFPSGHTSVSFAAAQYLQTREGWKYGAPAYALATIVGYSRVQAQEHYWTDVLAGAALGMASGYYFTDPKQPVQVGLSRLGSTTFVQVSTAW